MSRPIFSPVAVLEFGISPVPPPQVLFLGHRTLTPGQRLVDGRLFYSAAWLDQATSMHPEPLARTRPSEALANAAPLPSDG